MPGIIVNGSRGRMGSIIANALSVRREAVIGVDCTDKEEEEEEETAYPLFKSLESIPPTTVSDIDCIVDFSHHSCTQELLDFALRNSLPVVIATTGQNEEEKSMIEQASKKIPVFFSANYSMGITLLINLAKKVAAAMPGADIEIVETHHNRKIDAPSGTALSIASAIKEVRPSAEIVCGRNGLGKRKSDDIGISSIRYGNIAGIHEVHVSTDNECITLRHEAFSREVFADGAIAAADFIKGKPAGLYSMNSLISL